MSTQNPIRLKELAADIELELNRLRQLEKDITYVRQEVENAPIHAKLFYENLTLKLQSFYTGCERIFSLVAIELNGGVPSGSDWHKRLLDRMMTERETRIAVIRPETAKRLQEMLAFRHVVRSIYGFELDSDRIARLVDAYPKAWAQTQTDVAHFNAWLVSLATNLEAVNPEA